MPVNQPVPTEGFPAETIDRLAMHHSSTAATWIICRLYTSHRTRTLRHDGRRYLQMGEDGTWRVLPRAALGSVVYATLKKYGYTWNPHARAFVQMEPTPGQIDKVLFHIRNQVADAAAPVG